MRAPRLVQLEQLAELELEPGRLVELGPEWNQQQQSSSSSLMAPTQLGLEWQLEPELGP